MSQSRLLFDDCLLQTVQLFTVQVSIKTLAVDEQRIVEGSIPTKPSWPSILAWPLFAPAHRDSTSTIFSEMYWFCWRLEERNSVHFFLLTCVVSKHRASFYIQTYLNGSKRFFVQWLALRQIKTLIKCNSISCIQCEM